MEIWYSDKGSRFEDYRKEEGVRITPTNVDKGKKEKVTITVRNVV